MARIGLVFLLVACVGCKGDDGKKSQGSTKGGTELSGPATKCDAMEGPWKGPAGESATIKKLESGAFQATIKLSSVQSSVTIACEDGGIDVGGEGWLRMKGDKLSYKELLFTREK
jgi:hypothetical protein